MVIEETAGISALGFFKKKKKSAPDIETAVAPGIMSKLGPGGKGTEDGGSGGSAGGPGYLPYVFIGGALLVVGVAGYFILKK